MQYLTILSRIDIVCFQLSLSKLKSLIFYFMGTSNRAEVFCKKVVLKNFARFKRKHLCQSFFRRKVTGLMRETFLKKLSSSVSLLQHFAQCKTWRWNILAMNWKHKMNIERNISDHLLLKCQISMLSQVALSMQKQCVPMSSIFNFFLFFKLTVCYSAKNQH